jgi:superoxide reductase
MRFGELLKTATNEGKEKHVPVIELTPCKDCADTMVTVIVGKETPHPNTVEHHIGWIQLYGVRASGQLVSLGLATLTPVDTGNCAHFCVKKEGWKSFAALSYCNLHGVWESSVAL